MNDCPNEEVRDLLPLLAHGSLSVVETSRVRTHVAECAACAAELAMLETSRLVLRASAPRVDAALIGRALGSPRLKVVAGRANADAPRRRGWMPRQYVAAAASLLIVASLSLPFLQRAFVTGVGAVAPDTSVAMVEPTTGLPTSSGLSLDGGISDLSDADLTKLFAELETVEATIAAEPVTLRQPIVDTPEGM